MAGGDSRSGIDAPALVWIAANDILGVTLPGTTARQLGMGDEITRDNLVAGDLIFFRPTSMPRHVGIYLGRNEFVHSWPEGGVAIARLDNPYWGGAYWSARRLLAQPGVSVGKPANEDEAQPAQPRTRRRVGW